MSLKESLRVWVSPSAMERMTEFYRTVLEPLDYVEIVRKEDNNLIGYGYSFGELPILYLRAARYGQVVSPVDVNVQADSREQVDAFYNIAIQQGAEEKSKPELRRITSERSRYYTASVIDPEGNELIVIDGTKYKDYKEQEEFKKSRQ